MNIFSVFTKKQPSIACSFDNGYVRFVVLEQEHKKIQVVAHGSDFLGPDVFDQQDTIINDAVFVRKIKYHIDNLRKQWGINTVNVVVPNKQAIMFHTHIAKMPEKEMSDVIMDHIATYCESHNLLQVQEYICEYDIILETDFGYDAHVTLVPKKYIDHLNRLFRQAGVHVEHIETAHHAVARSCLRVPTGTGIVFVSFGESQTSISLLHGNHLVSEETVAVGSEHLYKTVERFLRVSRKEAEKIIDRHGIMMTHPDNGLLGELHLELAPIYRSVDRQLITVGKIPYKAFGDRFVTNTMIVYGAQTTIKGLVSFLGDKTQLSASLLDVWANHHEHRAPIMNLPHQETLTYAEPLSLALLYLKK